MKTRMACVVLGLLLVLVACQLVNQQNDSQPTPAPTLAPYSIAMQAAQQYLEAHLARPLGEVNVAYGEGEWPDTGLGCPANGQNYESVVTAGYQFEIETEGEIYELHTNADGTLVVLCPPKVEHEAQPSAVAQAAAVELLATQLGVASEAIGEPLNEEAAEWPSAALGCPQTGMAYADVVVEGYQFEFEYEGVSYDVRASVDGQWGTICLPQESAADDGSTPSIPVEAQAPLAAARQFLAAELEMPVDSLVLEAVTWESTTFPSSALGCPQEQETYASVLTEGYSFVLDYEGQSYEIHTDQTGESLVWCNPLVESLPDEEGDPTPSSAPAGMVFTSYANQQLGVGISYPLGWIVNPRESESEIYFGLADGDPYLGMLIAVMQDAVGEPGSWVADYRIDLFINDPSAQDETQATEIGEGWSTQLFRRDLEGTEIVERVTFFPQGLRVIQWAPRADWLEWDDLFLLMLDSLVMGLDS